MQATWRVRAVWVLSTVVVMAAVLMLWDKTQAQRDLSPQSGEVVAMQIQPPPPQPPGAPQPGQPFPGAPPGGAPLPDIVGRLAAGQVAVAANSEFVYVVRGNMLYQFSARDLRLLNSVELPRPRIIPRAGAVLEGTGQEQQNRLRRRLQNQARPPVQP